MFLEIDIVLYSPIHSLRATYESLILLKHVHALYTVIFSVGKNENVIGNILKILIFFAQNIDCDIDCGYTLKLLYRSPQSHTNPGGATSVFDITFRKHVHAQYSDF